MFNKDSQFISVLKFDNQVKIDFKKLKNEKLEKSEESTFIIYDEILSKEIATKLNAWQKDTLKTYISTLCLCEDEKIISKTTKRLPDYNKASLNTNLDVVLKSSKLFEVQHYFEFTGLDYVYSPFHVLNLHLEQNPSSNSLIVLTVNDYIYVVIVDELNKIVFDKIYKTTNFKDIKDSRFYNSDVIGQKLYDEVYALELQNFISKTIKEYYSKKSNNFIERIDILYTIKQLSDEQIQAIEDDLLISVHYHYVSLKESLYELSHGVNNLTQSYVKPRIKKKSSSLKWIFFGLISLGILSGLAIKYENEIKDILELKKEKVQEIVTTQVSSNKTEEAKKEETKKIEIPLPNHISLNSYIKNEIKTILDVIPYDMTLDSLDLKFNNSIITGKMITPDSYIKDIQPQLLSIYKYSNIEVKDSKNIALDVIIYNNEIINKDRKVQNLNAPKYINDGFIPVKRVTDMIKIILPKSAVVNFDSTNDNVYSTYNYRVNVIIENPIEFYMLIDNINKEKYSINLAYPIVFIKNSNGIEVDFGLQFNQNL